MRSKGVVAGTVASVLLVGAGVVVTVLGAALGAAQDDSQIGILGMFLIGPGLVVAWLTYQASKRPPPPRLDQLADPPSA